MRRLALPLAGLLAWAPAPAWGLPSPGPEAPPEAVVRAAARAYPPWAMARLGVAQAEAEASVALFAFDPLWRGKLGGEQGNYPKQELDLALSQVLPQTALRWEVGHRLGQGSYASYEGKDQTNAGGELRAGLSAPLLRFRQWDRRRADLAKAALGLGVARAEAEALALEAYRELSRRHWAWVAARGVQGLAGELARAAEARASDVQRASALGALAPAEALEARRGAIARQAELVGARRQVEAQALAYALWRRDASGAWALPQPEGPATLPLPSALAPEPDEAQAWARAPQRRRWSALAEGARLEADLAAEWLLPALDLQAMVRQDLGPGSTTRAQPDLALGLAFEWPWWQRGPEARRQVAELAAQRAQLQLRLAEDQWRLGLADAASAARAAQDRARWQWQDAQLALQLARLEGARLRLGEGTAFAVNLREQVAFEAARRAWEAQAEALAAQAAWRAARLEPALLAWLGDQAR